MQWLFALSVAALFGTGSWFGFLKTYPPGLELLENPMPIVNPNGVHPGGDLTYRINYRKEKIYPVVGGGFSLDCNREGASIQLKAVKLQTSPEGEHTRNFTVYIPSYVGADRCRVVVDVLYKYNPIRAPTPHRYVTDWFQIERKSKMVP